MSLRCLELFAGAGGAAIGLERAGLTHAALCEWDRDACATLRAAGLGPVVEGDVRDLGAIAAAVGPDPVDVMWSSFPCQAWSATGKRRGAADERNGWPWTLDAIDRFKPTWFLGENVRGLMRHRKECPTQRFGLPDPDGCAGCYFEIEMEDALSNRYERWGHWVLDAADYGVPQHRQRVILWAGPKRLDPPPPTHGPGQALPWVSMGEALGLDGEWIPMSTGSHGDGRKPTPITGPSTAITIRSCSPAPWSAAGTTYLAQPCPTLGAGHDPVVSMQIRTAIESEIEALTGKRRRLTTVECAILQDFPAGHPFQGGTGAQYRQIGNAVPPRLAEVVGRTLLEAAR